MSIVFLAIVIASPQTDVPTILSLKAGDRLRVSSREQHGIFIFHGLRSDTLILQTPDSAAIEKLAVTDLYRLEVSMAHISRIQGARRGFMFGFLCGVSTGVVTALVWPNDEPEKSFFDLSKNQLGVTLGIGLGAAGGIIGAVIGAVHPAEEWAPLELGSSFGMGVDDTSSLRMHLTIRF